MHVCNLDDNHVHIEFKFVEIQNKQKPVMQIVFQDATGRKKLGLISTNVFYADAKCLKKNYVHRFLLHKALIKRFNALMAIRERALEALRR